MTDFSSLGNYGVDPWANISLNERPFYDPLLRDTYLRKSVYSQHVTMKVDLNGEVKARTIYFNDLIPPRPNIAPINPRAYNATRLFTDSFQRSVTTERYGNGMSVNKESNMFNYWKKNGRDAGLIAIIQQSMGQVVVDHLDTLARNAFFAHPYPARGTGSATSFGGIASSEIMSTDIVDGIWLALRDRQKPYNAVPDGYVTGDETMCLTTAGAVYDLKREVGSGAGGLNFVDVHKYQEGSQLITGELGMYRGIRFVDSQFARLWNCGTVSHQTTITAALRPGAGAPDPSTTKVEGARMVGQPGATHSITVASTSGFTAGDMITIHKYVHDSASLLAVNYNGVIGGVDYTDPMRQDVEIHAVVDSTHLSIKEPYMMSDENGLGLETDLGGGVFGYITIGTTIHSALFLNPGLASQALIAGVAQPPEFYTPDAIDDYMSVFRVAYDVYIKYQLWDARMFHLQFLRGANSLIGKQIFH